MASSAGYGSVVKMQGASNVITGEATSYLSGSGSTKVYQITTAAHRVLNPGVAVVVKDGVSTVASTDYTIDYLFGKIRFTAHAVVGAITLDGAWLTMWEITTAAGFTLDDGYQLLDTTPFNSTGDKTCILGERDASGTITHFDVGADDYSGGASVTIKANLARDYVLVECTPVPSGEIFRAWARFSKESLKSSPDSLAQGSVSWNLNSRGVGAGCAWSDE